MVDSSLPLFLSLHTAKIRFLQVKTKQNVVFFRLPRATKSLLTDNKISLGVLQNYFQALKIYFQALVIYFQALIIYFQGLKIIFRHAHRTFLCSQEEVSPTAPGSSRRGACRQTPRSVCLSPMGHWLMLRYLMANTVRWFPMVARNSPGSSIHCMSSLT